MGSVSAMSSLDRVIARHGDELRMEVAFELPKGLRPRFRGVSLSNEVYAISTRYAFQDNEELPGPKYDIDDMAERFPCCEVGY